MSCRGTKLTKDQAANARKNPSETAFQPLLNQTQEETGLRLDDMKSFVSLKDDKYYLFNTIPVKTRVSEVSKRKVGLRESNIDPDNEIKRQGGTAIHAVAQALMDLYVEANGKDPDASKLGSLRNEAMNGEIKMQLPHFGQLRAIVEETYKNIQAQQKVIDPKGTVKIYTEQFIMDFIEDKGGTIDVLAVFSDNTASLYDYKTSGRRNALGIGKMGKTVLNNLFPFYDIRAFDLSMTEYKRILTERIGIKAIRQNRLLPIAVEYKWKPKGDRKEGDSHLPQLETLIAHQVGNENLKPIPTGGEQSRWEGINKLLEKQYRLLHTLSGKLISKGISPDEKSHIKDKIAKIEKSIIRTLDDEDILDLIHTIQSLTVEAKTRLNEPKLKDEKDNPSYLNDNELDDIYKEMQVYDDFIANTYSYFSDIKKENPLLYEKLLKGLTDTSALFDTTLVAVKLEIEKRGEDLINRKYRDEKGHLLPFKEMHTGDLTFLKMSEFTNPVFKAAWKLIEDAQYETKRKFEGLDEKVYSKTEAIFKWAHDNLSGVDKRMQAWKMLIDEKSGNLHYKLSKKFVDERASAIEKKDDDSIKFFKDNYEFKDKDQWIKSYAERLESQKAFLRASHNNLEATTKITEKQQKERYKESLDTWITNNNLLTSGNAWLQSYNRKFLKIKDEALKANYSEEYKRIASITPLREFYEMWTDYMEEFAEIFGISDYHKLPPNFIPNIRKEMIEHLQADSFHPMAAMSEMIDAFNVREEDIYISNVNEEGLTRQIPIMFLNKFKTKDGKIDNNRKSYDLSKSLMIFGKMAYNYEHMLKIEPKIIALKTLLGEPSPEQGGIQSTDRFDRRIKGKIQPFLTKEGRMTETYKLFEDITDAYLYGIKYKEKSLLPGVDTTHVLSRFKNINAQLKLSFAIIPASGAYVAGKLGAYITGKKGIMYTSEQWNETFKIKAFNHKLYKAIGNDFDPENDSYLERALEKHKASKKAKWLNSRTGFAPLREADTDNMRDILLSMSQNYGVNKEGNIIRLNRKGINPEGYTKIIDLYEKQSDGSYKRKEGALSKEGYKQFRAAVKSVGGSVFGNMNPDDIGRMETSLLVNQAMGFRTWIPAVVRERIGKTRWNEETQAVDIGRFRAYLGEYAKDFNEEQLTDGHNFLMYSKHVLVPNLSKLIVDLTTFGLAPKMGLKRVNEAKAKRAFFKFIAENPGLRETVTFDDFLEAKEAQIKAMLVELRIIIGIMSMALFLAGAGDDGKPRYYSNWATRNLYKIFSKAGSELTFMWNPTEFIRLMSNPFPVTGLVTQLKNTIVNGIDESRDFVFGENSPQDKTPPGYYMFQWIYGAPQMMRFMEVYEQMKKNPYSIYNTGSR